MQLKDYYSILELPASATTDEIKKAYRRLAHQYHPDKKGNDPYAAAQFAEVKEAYEVLSNPLKKDYYLQQRWYAQSKGQRTTQLVITPVNILKQTLELEKYVSTLDIHRMDKAGLYEYINNLLSPETIEKINSFNEPDINKNIIEAALSSSRHLSYRHIQSLSTRFFSLYTDASVKKLIGQHIRQSQQAEKWDHYKPWALLLLTLLLCTLIFLFSR
jgi:curved DNA-binding protein CbpA